MQKFSEIFKPMPKYAKVYTKQTKHLVALSLLKRGGVAAPLLAMGAVEW